MTYILKYLAQANKGDFKSLKITPTTDGMTAKIVDTIDGQCYIVDVKPLGLTLSKEAIKAIKKGNEVKCVLCGEILEDEEIIENTGYCNYCQLQVKKDDSDGPFFADDEKQL